jgi:hypothetical protein
MAAPADGPPRQAVADHVIALAVGLAIALITLSNAPLWWKYTPFHAHKPPISALPQKPTSPSASAQPAIQQLVDVLANVAVSEASGGFDTRVHLQRNHQVSLQASGSIFYGYEGADCFGTPQTGPDGHRTVGGRDCGTKLDPQVPAPSYPVGSLLWRVGASAWQEVGASKVIVAPMDGDLYLGINDDTIEDNQGSFVVSVNA